MFNEWKTKTADELVAELKDRMRRAEKQAEEYNQAARDKPKGYNDSGLAETNQEIVEKWMVIGMLKGKIVEAYLHEFEANKKSPHIRGQRRLPKEAVAEHLEAGKRYLEQSEYYFAIPEFNAILNDDLRHGAAYYYRGRVFNELNKWPLAVSDLTAAVQFEPKMVAAYWKRSQAYSRLRQYELEIGDLNHVIRLSPSDHTDAYRHRGLAHYLIEQYKKALADFDEAIRLASTDADAYYFRGGVYMELGEYKRALADCEMALKLSPQSLPPKNRIKEIREKMSKR